MFASASPFFGISRGSYADRADLRRASEHYNSIALRHGLLGFRAWRVSMRSIDFGADYKVGSSKSKTSTNPFETPGPPEEEQPKHVSYRDASGRVHFTTLDEATAAPVTPAPRPPGAGMGHHSPLDAALTPMPKEAKEAWSEVRRLEDELDAQQRDHSSAILALRQKVGEVQQEYAAVLMERDHLAAENSLLGQQDVQAPPSEDGLDRSPPQTEFAQQRWEFLFAQANGDRLVLSEMLSTKEKARYTTRSTSATRCSCGSDGRVLCVLVTFPDSFFSCMRCVWHWFS